MGKRESSKTASLYRADIQGLRAVAVIAVVLFHVGGLLPGGYLGVDVFFVISGFVVSQGIFERISKGRTFRLERFLLARFRRLAPELFLMVAVVLTISLALLPERGGAAFFSSVFAIVGLSNLWFSQNYVGYFGGIAKLDPLLHTWSLGVEEQFYLGLALLVTVAARTTQAKRGSVIRVLLGCVLFLASVSLVLAAVGWTALRVELPFGQGFVGYFSPIPRLWEFSVGVLLAGLRHLQINPMKGIRRLASTNIGAGLLLLVLFAPTGGDTGGRFWATLAAVTGVALVIAGGAEGNNPARYGISRALESKKLKWIGDRSYSIYLWHWPAIIIVDALKIPYVPQYGGVALGLVAAYLSHKIVARPWRSVEKVDLPKLASFGVLAVGPIAVTALLLAVLPSQRLSEGIIVLSGQKSPTIGRESGCLLERDFSHNDINRCKFGSSEAYVALVGDSHADALSDGVVDAAGSLGLSTLALTGAGCDFTQTPHNLESEVSNCGELAGALIERFRQHPLPSAVIISETGISSHVIPALREIDEAGIPVILVRDVPWIRPNLDIGSGDVEEGPCALNGGKPICQVSIKSAMAHGLRDSEEVLIRSFQFAQVIDPWAQLCDEHFCYGIMGSQVLYWDSDHLNSIGSSFLSPEIGKSLRSVVSK